MKHLGTKHVTHIALQRPTWRRVEQTRRTNGLAAALTTIWPPEAGYQHPSYGLVRLDMSGAADQRPRAIVEGCCTGTADGKVIWKGTDGQTQTLTLKEVWRCAIHARPARGADRYKPAANAAAAGLRKAMEKAQAARCTLSELRAVYRMVGVPRALYSM